MTRSLFTLVFFFCAQFLFAQHSIRIELVGLPANHNNSNSLYIAGAFNSWNPKNEQYKFQQDEKGRYFILLKLNSGSFEYKITRGGWDKVECSKSGGAIGNRVLKVDADVTIELTIDGWQDQFNAKPKISTASPNVRIIDTAFFIPQLQRTRRIWIYWPNEATNARHSRYPVLYMHDGQNIFEDTSSFSGEWGIDEFLDTTQLKNCIVVGIDNGKDKRSNEYNPYDHERFGKGEGDAYVDFIVNTLKPYIDKNYPTLKEKKHTFIAGSSMGGLISMYAVMKYPKVFGGAGVFSPAFWTAPKIFDDLKKKSKKINSNIFFYVGKLEGERMMPDMLKAVECLSGKSKSKIKNVILDDGKHDEATWRKEFPLGYQWMVFGADR